MFIHDWKKVLRKAWSVRLMFLAALFSAIEIGLPLLDGIFYIPSGLFASLTMITTFAAFVARFYAQKEFKDGDKA